MRTCTDIDTIRTANETSKIPARAASKTVDYRPEVFLHQFKQYTFRNQNNKRDIMFFMKIRPLIRRRICIGRRLDLVLRC